MSPNEELLTLQVTDVTAEAKDTLVIELRRPDGGQLPPFAPGAHLELNLANTLVRQYSLCNDSRDDRRYCIGVGLAKESRGGSLLIHRTLRVGDTLKVTAPRNNFPLAQNASRYEFIAGGIGITPILSMVRWCESAGKNWHLTYVCRNRQRAAFLETLGLFGDKLSFHADDEKGGLIDMAATVGRMAPESHIYCCGPSPLMHVVEAAAAGRPDDRVRFEWFVPKEIPSGPTDGFTVKLNRSGQVFTVPADKSILEVLEDAGMDIPFSCREGICAACETRVVSGVVDHRDSVLTTAERARNDVMMICCSRAQAAELVLDL